jgi:glycosyltransferase involved in cell wall biosynthesis
MRIGIDARFLTHPQKGGFKTYSENLITALARIDGDNEYVLYIDRPPEQNTNLPDSANFSYRIIRGDFPYIGMPWREQISLSCHVSRDRLDLLHSPCLTAPLRLSCASVVTIHDMIWSFPVKSSRGGQISLQRKMMDWYYRLIPQYAARRSDALITVSNAAKQDIIQHLKFSPDRIFVTYEAANPAYRGMDDTEGLKSVREQYDLSSRFILAIGSADPRKNIGTLIRAYAILPGDLRDRYQLAILWTHGLLSVQVSKEVGAAGLDKRVRFLEHVCDDDLVLLYNAASLFVVPSLYEGFGLPLLEAMACGTPVVAANNSSIPEIAGDAALLVSAENESSIAGAIAEVLSDTTLQMKLIERGFGRASHFSWTKCACQTLDVYRQALRMGK